MMFSSFFGYVMPTSAVINPAIDSTNIPIRLVDVGTRYRERSTITPPIAVNPILMSFFIFRNIFKALHILYCQIDIRTVPLFSTDSSYFCGLNCRSVSPPEGCEVTQSYNVSFYPPWSAIYVVRLLGNDTDVRQDIPDKIWAPRRNPGVV